MAGNSPAPSFSGDSILETELRGAIQRIQELEREMAQVSTTGTAPGGDNRLIGKVEPFSGASGKMALRRKDKACYRCGRKGHFSRQCRQSRKDQNNDLIPQKVSVAHQIITPDESDEEEDAHVDEVKEFWGPIIAKGQSLEREPPQEEDVKPEETHPRQQSGKKGKGPIQYGKTVGRCISSGSDTQHPLMFRDDGKHNHEDSNREQRRTLQRLEVNG
jgi:hypothetical protein